MKVWKNLRSIKMIQIRTTTRFLSADLCHAFLLERFCFFKKCLLGCAFFFKANRYQSGQINTNHASDTANSLIHPVYTTVVCEVYGQFRLGSLFLFSFLGKVILVKKVITVWTPNISDLKDCYCVTWGIWGDTLPNSLII